jgi:hypothetical protein
MLGIMIVACAGAIRPPRQIAVDVKSASLALDVKVEVLETMIAILELAPYAMIKVGKGADWSVVMVACWWWGCGDNVVMTWGGDAGALDTETEERDT